MAVNIEEFRNDLHHMTLEEACIKHNTTFREIVKLTPLQRKKTPKPEKPKPKPDKYISHKANRYYVQCPKTKKNITFKNVEDARTVRDELVKCGWDFGQLDAILRKNKIKKLPKYCRLNRDNAYVMKSRHGTYAVRKGKRREDGTLKYKNYGTYRTLEEACAVRDELILSHWNRPQLSRIKKKLGITNTYGR